MLSSSLESQTLQAKKLVKEAEDDDEARTEAVEKVNSLKETLKHLKDQVMDEAEEEVVETKHKKK